ncbi:MAG: hypothetical protein LBG66_00540, partial [Gallionellaceae bacterium]|nr:hypothetical protein [Gallionellaceae bacterium]
MMGVGSMALFGSLKPGEKVLFGVFIIIGLFAAASFIGMEVHRAMLKKQATDAVAKDLDAYRAALEKQADKLSPNAIAEAMENYRAKLEKQREQQGQMYPANTHYDFTEEGLHGYDLV